MPAVGGRAGSDRGCRTVKREVEGRELLARLAAARPVVGGADYSINCLEVADDMGEGMPILMAGPPSARLSNMPMLGHRRRMRRPSRRRASKRQASSRRLRRSKADASAGHTSKLNGTTTCGQV